MSNHDELIERLRASAAAMPFDAAVAVQYRAAADALEAQAREIEGLRKEYDMLIRQMLEALENHDGNYKLSKSAGAAVNAAITAGRARLEGKP